MVGQRITGEQPGTRPHCANPIAFPARAPRSGSSLAKSSTTPGSIVATVGGGSVVRPNVVGIAFPKQARVELVAPRLPVIAHLQRAVDFRVEATAGDGAIDRQRRVRRPRDGPAAVLVKGGLARARRIGEPQGLPVVQMIMDREPGQEQPRSRERRMLQHGADVQHPGGIRIRYSAWPANQDTALSNVSSVSK
jgi:hypothetical protein